MKIILLTLTQLTQKQIYWFKFWKTCFVIESLYAREWQWPWILSCIDLWIFLLQMTFTLFRMLIWAFWMTSVLGVLSGSGSCAPPAVGRVSAKWNSDPCVSGLPLLSRNRPRHPSDLRTSAAATRSHRHRPAVPAARFLVRSSVCECLPLIIQCWEFPRKLTFRCLLIEMETKEEENQVNMWWKSW